MLHNIINFPIILYSHYMFIQRLKIELSNQKCKVLHIFHNIVHIGFSPVKFYRF